MGRHTVTRGTNKLRHFRAPPPMMKNGQLAWSSGSDSSEIEELRCYGSRLFWNNLSLFCLKRQHGTFTMFEEKLNVSKHFIENIEVKLPQLVGQEVVAKTLKQAVEQEKISHAYLFLVLSWNGGNQC